jgi:replicative DNA helicase
MHTASEIIQRGHEGGGDVDAFLDEAERTIFEIGQDRARVGFVHLKEALKRSFKQIEQLYEKRSPVTGVPTGFTEIDRMTSGLQPGDLVILAGRPSMGKTALALNMAENASMHADGETGVAVFSLEMSTDQLVMRMLTSQGKVDASKLRAGYASQRDLDGLVHAADRLSRAPIFIDDTAAITILEMRAKSRRLLAEKGIGLIIVDYLQLMRGRPVQSMESREREISEISRGLKSLAKELKVPVVALSQLNRSLESRTDKRPMLSDLRESGALEQDADVIMFVYRDEVYHKESEDRGVAEIIIGKQRNGPTGVARVRFFHEYTRFENLAGEGGPG